MASLVCFEEIAYNEIRQRILDGRLAPGVRLVHRTLAKELEMSPNPVVLALRMLERDGLVTNTPGLGACVRVWTPAEIIDSYHIRAFHEALAARLCAERHTAAEMGAIDIANEEVKQSFDSSDAGATVLAELSLHVAIVRGTHCRDLERIFENMAIVHRCMTAFGITLNVPRLESTTVRDIHAPLVEAIRARDADAAEKAAREHVEDSLARNLAWIEKVSAVLENGVLGYGASRGVNAASTRK
ncbi:MAG: GntR family transcriptional regulator [Armatimonadota bacterium]